MSQVDKLSTFETKSTHSLSLSTTAKPPSFNSPIVSSYKSAANQYQRFLNEFEDRLQKIYNKQCYRIYLNDRVNERQYKELIKQKNQLIQALEDSKDYTQSVNRGLIEEIMNLQSIKGQYQDKNKQYENKIYNHKKLILSKKKELKQLQKEIKSYWIYNYDISNVSTNSKKPINSVYSTINTNKNSCMQSLHNSAIKQPLSTRIKQSKENDYNQINTQKKENNLACNSKNMVDSMILKPKQNQIHLPDINNKNQYGSLIKCQTNASIYSNSNHKNSSFSKDLSLLNCSVTKQKVLEKIQISNRRRIMEKLEYQLQKINLLKMFKIYLKKSIDSQQNLSQKMKIQKIVIQLNDQIRIKQGKLNQIQKLLSQ